MSSSKALTKSLLIKLSTLLITLVIGHVSFANELTSGEDSQMDSQSNPQKFICLDQNGNTHMMSVHKTHAFLDSNIYLFKDDHAQTVKYNRLTHSLFNNDDLDLVIPNTFISGDVTHGQAMLVDYQIEGTLDLVCERVDK